MLHFSATLPAGVRLSEMHEYVDHRGGFAELFRDEWETGIRPVQWNYARSNCGTLRGVHVHPTHDDYLVLLEGCASIGLKDLRRSSPTYGLSAVVELSGSRLQALMIPHGVAHGFYYHEPALHLYAVSHYWDETDELGCRWDSPGLDIPWRVSSPPLLSVKDARLPPLAELEAALERQSPLVCGAGHAMP